MLFRSTRRRPGVLPLRSVPEDAVLGVVEGLPAEELLWLGAVSAGPSCSALPYFCPWEPEVQAGMPASEET